MHDVVIIGAGVSGLLVARRLADAGHQPVVLEARARLGGRTWSPEGLDLGASWVWDSEQHVLALIQELDLELFDHHRDGADRFESPEGLQTGRLPRSTIPERRVVGGTATIAKALAPGLDVRLSTLVSRVEATADGLVFTTPQGTLSARRGVAAVPPALLATRIDLPGLSTDRRALLARTPVWMAEIAKVVVTYPEPFWRRAGLSGRAASLIGPMSELHDLSGPGHRPAALFGFVHRSMATGAWRARLVPQLVRLFGPEAAQPEAVHIAAWWEEPHTAPPDGPGTDPRLLGHPALREPLLEGRLFLGATETSGISPGHIDGAVERAETIAAHLTRALA